MGLSFSGCVVGSPLGGLLTAATWRRLYRMIRPCLRVLPLFAFDRRRLAGLLLERLQRRIEPGEGRLVHAVDEKDAVEMIDLVLDAA